MRQTDTVPALPATESAAHLLTNNIPVFSEHETVKAVEVTLHQRSHEYESINYVYILDDHNRLTKVLSVKELFQLQSSTVLAEVPFARRLISARASTDQERVAQLSRKHGIRAVPVVDKAGVFLGAVTANTITDILFKESTEDALRAGGTGKFHDPVESMRAGSVWLHVQKRLPWLLVGLVGGFLAALVVERFEGTWREHLVLAAFIPTIVYVADAVGAQSQTIFIRAMALPQGFNIRRYLVREVWVGLSLAAALGGLVTLVSWLWLGSGVVSAILGITILGTVIVSMVVAISLPALFERLHFDPAIVSGPSATVLRDILSLLIYFAVISLLL